jgi:undecaprenol kinase
MSSSQSSDNNNILVLHPKLGDDNVLTLPVANLQAPELDQTSERSSSLDSSTLITPNSVRNPFKAKHFMASVGFALEGLNYITRVERNFKIDLAMAVTAMVLGAITGLAVMEWAALIVVCGLVLFAEATNTAIELVVDMITQGEYDARAKVVKDVAAGACLMSATLAAIVGALVFIPHWIALLH